MNKIGAHPRFGEKERRAKKEGRMKERKAHPRKIIHPMVKGESRKPRKNSKTSEENTPSQPFAKPENALFERKKEKKFPRNRNDPHGGSDGNGC